MPRGLTPAQHAIVRIDGRGLFVNACSSPIRSICSRCQWPFGGVGAAAMGHYYCKHGFQMLTQLISPSEVTFPTFCHPTPA